MRSCSRAMFFILVLFLGGCVQPWVGSLQEQGVIQIVVHRTDAEGTGIRPMTIPSKADYVRIRVWHPESGFDTLRTASLGESPSIMDIQVPEGTGYRVDAVAYYVRDGRALALTGGRSNNVQVMADALTEVQLALHPWATSVDGTETVKPSNLYEVEMTPSDAAGLLSRETFRSATLHVATTQFDDPDDPLPAYPGTQGVVFDHRIVFASTAPDVTEETTLFVTALVEFVENWKDTNLNDRSQHVLYIEMPNRHMGEPLHELVVDPTVGGIIVEISSDR